VPYAGVSPLVIGNIFWPKNITNYEMEYIRLKACGVYL